MSDILKYWNFLYYADSCIVKNFERQFKHRHLPSNLPQASHLLTADGALAYRSFYPYGMTSHLETNAVGSRIQLGYLR